MIEKSAPQAPAKIAYSQRFEYIDGMRGLAALAVVLFHFYGQLCGNGAVQRLPGPLHWLLMHGDQGVSVFFVLSGFVISYVVQTTRITPSYFGRFALRRAIRLDPPYWLIIVATFIFLLIRSRVVADSQAASVTWHWWTVAANLFYLDDLLGVPTIVRPGWTLQLEFQFYLVFVLLCGIMQALAQWKIGLGSLSRLLVFAPFAIYSLAISMKAAPVPWHGLFIEYWYLFFLGAVVCWALTGQISRSWAWGCFLIVALAVILIPSVQTWAGLATAGSIFLLGLCGRLKSALSWRWVQYLGTISYSLYLVHTLIGHRLILWAVRNAKTDGVPETGISIIVFLSALVLSFLAAHLLNRLVERPSQRFSRHVSLAGDRFVMPPCPLIEAITRNKRWLRCAAAFALLWSVALFGMQQLTLVAPNNVGLNFIYLAAAIRFFMDLLFCVSLTLLLPRWASGIAVTIAVLSSIGLIVYKNYFLQPLSFLTILNQQREGLLVAEFAVKLIPAGIAAVACGILAIEWGLLIAAKRPRFTWRQLAAIGFACSFLYGSAFVILDQVDPLNRILTKRGVGRLGMVHGYLETWLAEWHYLTDETILKRAIAKRAHRSDRLTPQEGDLPIGDHVVLVQCESLDFRLLDYQIHGQELTPFLNALKQRSFFFRIEAMHSNGTADADFAALVGYGPSHDVITYNIPNYPYENTFPQQMQKLGFTTQSLHGYWGSFYNRRFAFQKMGFDTILFQEELSREYHLPVSKLGIVDHDVFQVSADLLNHTPGRVFQFIITLSTHGPFDSIAPSERRIYPDNPSLYQNYLNSIYYLDRSLAAWYEQLPLGTTVMLYGDQAADQDIGDFHADRDPATRAEYTPCLIFKKGTDFSKLQRTRNLPIAFSGELSLLDLIWYFRGQIEKTFAPPAKRHADTGSEPPGAPAR
jgi:hypothetical protein